MALTRDYSNVLDNDLSDKTNWTQTRASEMASKDYNFSNGTLKGALDAMGNTASYDKYKKLIDAATKAKDADALYDIMKQCIDKIEARSPGSVDIQEKDDINGVKVKVNGSESKSAEGKAIRLILTGGGNWFTGLFLPTKIRQAGGGARKALMKSELKEDLTNIADKIMYGARRLERDGSTGDIIDGVGDNIARSMLLEDIGFSEKGKALQEAYQPTLDRYRSMPRFIDHVQLATAQRFIELTKGLPDSAINEQVQKDLAECRGIANASGAWATRAVRAASSADGSFKQGKELYKSIQQANKGSYGGVY